MDFLTLNNDGIIIRLKVIPNSSKNMFIQTENELKLKITVPPIENKANKFVVEYIAKSVKLPKTSIEILKGDTSREKVLFLSVLDKQKRSFIVDYFSNL